MDTLYAVLFSWATTLGAYHGEVTPPTVEYRPKSFFVENACRGSKNCSVVGWYAGGNTVYIDEKLDVTGNQIASSIIVHEYVHYLQEKSGKPHKTCKDIIDLEREAYSIQKQYLLINGVLANHVGLSVVSMNCEE